MKKENFFQGIATLSCLAMACVIFITYRKSELILKLIDKILVPSASIDVINQIKDSQIFIFNSLLAIIGFFITIVLFFLGFTLIYNKDFEKRVAENIKELESSLINLKKMTAVNKYFQELVRVQCYSECKITRLNTLRNKECQFKKQYPVKNSELDNESNEKLTLLLNFKTSALLENSEFERALEKYDELLELSPKEDKGRLYYRKAYVKWLILEKEEFENKLKEKQSLEKFDEILKLCNKSIEYSNEKQVAAYHLKGNIYKIKASSEYISTIQKNRYLEVAKKNIEKAINLGLRDDLGIYYEIEFEMLENKEKEFNKIMQKLDYDTTEESDSKVIEKLNESKEKILLELNKLDNYSNKYGDILNFLNLSESEKVDYIMSKLKYLLINTKLEGITLLNECNFLLEQLKEKSFNDIGYFLIIKSLILKNKADLNEAIRTCCIGIKKCKIELSLNKEDNKKDNIYSNLGLGFYVKGELSELLSNGNPKKCYTISSHYYKKITNNIGKENDIFQKKCADKIDSYTSKN